MLEAQVRATTTGGTASPPPSGSDTESVVSNTTASTGTPAPKRRKTNVPKKAAAVAAATSSSNAFLPAGAERPSASPPRNAFMELATVASHLAGTGPSSVSGIVAETGPFAQPPASSTHSHPHPPAHSHHAHHHHHHHHAPPLPAGIALPQSATGKSPVVATQSIPSTLSASAPHAHSHPHSHLHSHASNSHPPHWHYGGAAPPSVLLPASAAPTSAQFDLSNPIPTTLNLKDLANLRDALGAELNAAKEQIGRLEGFVKRGDAFVKLLDDAVRQSQALPSSTTSMVQASPAPVTSTLPRAQESSRDSPPPTASLFSTAKTGEKRPFTNDEDLDAYLSSIPHQPAIKLPPRTKSAPAGLVVPASTVDKRPEGEQEVTKDVVMKEDKDD